VGDWKRRAITDAGRVVEGTDPKVRASGPDPLAVSGGDHQPVATIVSPWAAHGDTPIYDMTLRPTVNPPPVTLLGDAAHAVLAHQGQDADEGKRRAPAAVASRGEWLWNYDADTAFEEALASSTLRARAVLSRGKQVARAVSGLGT
jgi:hypothetical protein